MSPFQNWGTERCHSHRSDSVAHFCTHPGTAQPYLLTAPTAPTVALNPPVAALQLQSLHFLAGQPARMRWEGHPSATAAGRSSRQPALPWEPPGTPVASADLGGCSLHSVFMFYIGISGDQPQPRLKGLPNVYT